MTSRFKVMIAGLFSLVLTLGVARFAYTPLLPVMLDQTFLTDASGGWLGSINYIGYMTGALIAASVSDFQFKDRLYRLGLIVAIVTTIGMALAENYWLWSIMRFLAGMSSAAGLLIGSGLILNWMVKHGYRAELGLHFGGIGVGIAVSAAVAILMHEQLSWAMQWTLFAGVGLLLMIPAWHWFPKPCAPVSSQQTGNMQDRVPSKSWMQLLYAAYFCAGFGYAVSATFLVTIVDTQQSLIGYGNLVWLVTGLAASPACILWDRIARRLTEISTLILAYSINIVGIILLVFNDSLAGILFSGVLFGYSFIGIVSLMLTMVGKHFPSKPAKPMGKLTLSYGSAQIIAPAISGMIAEMMGSYHLPLMMAAAIVFLGIGFLILLRIQEQC